MRPALTRTLASAALAAAMLAACGQSPVIQLYQLRAEPPQSVPPAAVGAPVWQLLPMTWPGYLDREAVLRPAGQAALQSVPGARWAEPLRDAVPRLLLADLDRLRGSGTVFKIGRAHV